jgi:hypothetical protein
MQAWCVARSITSYQTDYSVASLVHILNTVNVRAVISFISDNSHAWLTVHDALLKACTQSHSCKRLMPAEVDWRHFSPILVNPLGST